MLMRLSIIATACVLTFAVRVQAQGESDTVKPVPATTSQGTAPQKKVFGEDTLASRIHALEEARPWSDVMQFDAKGVEFGPWVRRFLAQVKRNWMPLIPEALMSLRGHTVVKVVVHKDGSLDDARLWVPSPVEGFNGAALEAIERTELTIPLPPEYPDEQMDLTVTFYYNETPTSAEHQHQPPDASLGAGGDGGDGGDGGWSPE